MKRKNESVALVAIGRRIQIARNKRRTTVARLSVKTAISTRFINHIEAGEFSKLPGQAYVLGFTRSICRDLELDPEEVVQVIKSEMYPNSITQFERTIAPYMTRPLIAKISSAFRSVLQGIMRSKQV